ncbi:DUF4954 family protein [Treponema parvum]|uniref:DUF4954 family protein n=1 Tax=Treponema parvum TaxID=138851 RepID=A0A975F109_9SPIR|nr:DUF4954 family protein [Treponema parvum]QTQ12295.1 DUF4954 family protein [Treponema parvum]
MSSLTLLSSSKKTKNLVPAAYEAGKRALTETEIEILQKNGNSCTSLCGWQNFRVCKAHGEFDPELIKNCEFSGFVVIGKLRPAKLKYHDLELECGFYNSYIKDSVFGDDCVIRNVSYLENYHIHDRVILFNIQEMNCTLHSKFGNGILKEGEPESNRIWIGVANENDGRSVLPFEQMITADAYLWSHYRDDKELLQRFFEMTEYGNTKKLDTFGIVEDDAVIKNTTLIKDVKVGSRAYIKGAFKLKNITVLSSAQEPSQIGEGVEMVNGIMGYGSRVFYQAVAVRFVIGRNCQLKYGVRVLNTVLGDNSTVSCCELLNNLIFPFHEQHHNSSFLIATTVMGQSNIAAGATVGSNHNSRSPDGEIFAKRGFWPGLCSDFKHNSKFASFTLAEKGSYQHELHIAYPFSLIASEAPDKPIRIIPAFWFLYNMFAIARNNDKFLKRDRRAVKIQHIETDPFAPDTMQEIFSALDRIIELSGYFLSDMHEIPYDSLGDGKKMRQAAKDYLHTHPDADFTLTDMSAQKKYGAIILKPVKAYKAYRKVVKYFAARTLVEYCGRKNILSLKPEHLESINRIKLYTEWENVGGQIIPKKEIQALFKKIKNRTVRTWQEVHKFYDKCQAEYDELKARYSVYLLEQLYSRPIGDFTSEIFRDIITDVTVVSDEMYQSSLSSRQKDFTDYFRKMVYHNYQEMTAVLGSVESNSFLLELKNKTDMFNKNIKVVFGDLCRIP